jgi:hypothetical protein
MRLAREGRTVRLVGHQAIPGGGRRHQVRRGDRINSYRLEKEGIKVKNLIDCADVLCKKSSDPSVAIGFRSKGCELMFA